MNDFVVMHCTNKVRQASIRQFFNHLAYVRLESSSVTSIVRPMQMNLIETFVLTQLPTFFRRMNNVIR